MGFFSNFFAARSRRQYFPPPASVKPPQPEGAWSIIVDAHGDPVRDRPAECTDFLARPAVSHNYGGGTYPIYKYNSSLGRDENNRAWLDYQIRNRRNGEYLNKAIFLLSQTDDGLRLLSKAKSLSFSIAFDPELCAEENALGLCDYANRRIPLAEGRSPYEVALTLKHELQHMEDIEAGLSYGMEDSPRIAITANRALEGNARVSEAVAAAELLIGSPSGPVQQFRSSAFFDSFWRKNNPMAQAAYDALDDAASGKWTSFAARIFPSYFKQDSTLAYYDERYAKYIESYVPNISRLKSTTDRDSFNHHHAEDDTRKLSQITINAQNLFTNEEESSDDVASQLKIRGLPYAQEINPQFFSLASETAYALTKDAVSKFEKLKANILAVLPGSDKVSFLDLPVFTSSLISTPLPSPYAAHAPQEENFAAIQMPVYTDGPMLTNGRRTNANTTEIFTSLYKKNDRGGSVIDRLNYTIGHYFLENRGVGNVRGRMCSILDTGFLAPVGAFPPEYIHDLWGRISMASEAAEQGTSLSVSLQELKLVEHWQTLKEKGLDPIWGDPQTKTESWLAKDNSDTAFWAGILVNSLKDTKKSGAVNGHQYQQPTIAP